MSTPRLAATVMLARPGPRGFELYMARRSRQSAFAADAFVFPGGAVEAQDLDERMRARTLGLGDERIAVEFRATIPSELPSDEPPVDRASASALLAAALRELFEEAGILLARTRADAIAGAELRSDEVQSARMAMARGELSFVEFLEGHDWFADAEALTLFSHWITPPSERRRFNTHFFFALAPHGQVGEADAVEMHEGLWIAPHDALARYEAGSLRLVYPTIKHLERLASFKTLDALQTFARHKPVLTILPETTVAGGFAMPEVLEGAW